MEQKYRVKISLTTNGPAHDVSTSCAVTFAIMTQTTVTLLPQVLTQLRAECSLEQAMNMVLIAGESVA